MGEIQLFCSSVRVAVAVRFDWSPWWNCGCEPTGLWLVYLGNRRNLLGPDGFDQFDQCIYFFCKKGLIPFILGSPESCDMLHCFVA